jgi:predicted ribosomally synthesized peptide with nif11-like leader
MSMQSLQSFREKVNINPDLEAAIKTCLNGPDGVLDADAVVALGRQQGFDFSQEELLSAMRGTGGEGLSEELSDLELELVSGGNPVNCNDGAQRVAVPK